MYDALTDLKLALRRLRRAPGFALTVVATLTVAIGGITSVFAVVNAVLFAPLPYGDASRLVEIWATQSPAHTEPADYLSGTRVDEWLRTEFRTLDGFSVRGATTLVLRRDEGTVRIPAEVVSGRYFGVVQAFAQLGRVLDASDDRPEAESTAVLSHAAWQDYFSGDQSIVGRTVHLSGRPHTVVGVMPATFASSPTIWVPRSLPTDVSPIAWTGVARLRANEDRSAATLEISTLAASEVQKDSVRYGGQGAVAVSVDHMLRRSRDGSLWAALGVMGAIFLIALANLTVLFLARAARSGEATAVRVALGASRWNLARPHFAEGALLAVAGTILALVVAQWGIAAAMYWIGPEYNLPVEPGIDLRVTAFALGLGFLCALVLLFEPLRHVRRADLHGLLKRSSPTFSMGVQQRRTRNALVGLQVAVGVVLVGTAGVAAFRYSSFLALEMGYDDAMVATAVPDYEAGDVDADQQPPLAAAVLERLSRRPEIDGTALWRFIMQSYPPEPQHSAVLDDGLGERSGVPVNYLEVSPGFFDVMDVAVREGRTFALSDDQGAEPVAIVTEDAAGRWWPEGPLLGRRIRFGDEGAWVTVVGVVENIGSMDYLGRFWGAGGTATPQLFRPLAQAGQRAEGWSDGEGCVGRCGGVTIAARASDDPSEALSAIRHDLALIAPDLPLREIGTLLDRQLSAYGGREMRISRALLAAAATLGTLLTLIGVVGVVSEGVSRRTKEVGIRLAIGAPSWRVVGLVARESTTTVLVGLGVGLLTSRLLRSALQSLFVPFADLDLGSQVGDWSVLAATASLILVVSSLVTLVGASRAARIDPTRALQSE